MLTKVFRTRAGTYYAYDPLTNRIITIQKDFSGKEEAEAEQEILSGLLESGWISDRAFSDIIWQDSFEAFLERTTHDVPRLMLQITQRCNLNCSYCVYSGNYAHMKPHANEDMTEECIRKSIDYFAQRSKGCQKVSVDMYGGEALLCLDKMQYAVAYAEEVLQGKTITFRLTTNGMLLKEKVCRWLLEHPNVQITVTVNGPFHDLHRVTPDGHGSLDTILKNLRYIREQYPQVWRNQIQFISNVAHSSQLVPLKAFYDQEIGKPPVSITHIRTQHGNEVIQEILSEKTNPDVDDALREQFCQQEDPFLDAYFGAGMRAMGSRHLFPEDTRGYVGSCFPLVDRIFVHSNGDLGICESACDKVVVGHIDRGYDEQVLRRIYEGTRNLFAKKCGNCWAQRLCTICMKDLFAEDGTLLQELPERLCQVSREYSVLQLQMFCELVSNQPDRLK